MSEHHHDHHDHHDDLAELLDLDAELFAPELHAVYEDIERAADQAVRSVIDLGAGTGTGTFGLLQHFTSAHAVAIDASADMLAHLEQEAAHRGLADRVTIRRADLDEGVPAMDAVDLAWAAASLHHLTDPDRTLAQVAAVIRPGGLLAVAELDGFPRFLPADTRGAAAELRAHELLAADRIVDMPTMGSDWGSRLERAGLVVEQHRPISLDLASPVPAAAGRYAALTLTRIRQAVAERLDVTDREAFDALLDGGPEDLRRRTDLRVVAERQLWIARRPA